MTITSAPPSFEVCRPLGIAGRPHWRAGLTVVLLLCGSSTCAGRWADERGFLDRVYTDGTGEHRYAVFVPEGEAPAQGWPVILFLHGAGERGSDGRKPLEYGIGPAVRRRAESFPAIVVFPQADFAEGPILETWRAEEPGGLLARAILSDVEQQWPVDPTRRAITGWSMGGYGALSLAAADPVHWSRVLAVSCGGEPAWVKSLLDLPVLLVHGDRDGIVPPAECRAMAAAFPAGHDRMAFLEVPAAGHDLWQSVYGSNAVLEWLTSNSQTLPSAASLSTPAEGAPSVQRAEEPLFSPVLLISRAISLRLGNDALMTLAAGVPDAIGEAGLTGVMDPLSDQVSFQGRTFDVHFTRMSYRGQLARAVLQGHGADRLRLGFALRDFELVIGEIQVTDAADRVQAGPVSVIIGHRQPVWMNLEVRPVATADGTLELQLLRSEFAIPDFNWYVNSPESIRIDGEFFTEDAVRTAIVGGVYRRKDTIEQKIREAVPRMLQQIEKRVDFSQLAELVTALWPLPVYEPRLRVSVEETSTDRDGVSLVFGCAVAGIDSRASRPSLVRVSASIPAAYQIERTRDLRAAIATDVMEHLSAMVAGTEVAELYTADVPGRPFEELEDVASVVAAASVDVSPGTVSDVRSRLQLSDAFTVSPAVSLEQDSRQSLVRVLIAVPRLSMTCFGTGDFTTAVGRSPAEGEPAKRWVPLAERELFIRQPLRLTTTTSVDGPTMLSVNWETDAMSVGRVDEADAASASSTERDTLTEDFRNGWQRWAASQQQAAAPLPDVTVGASLMRLQRFFWDDNRLTAQFLPAATVLTNRTERPIGYHIRGPHSRWSRELTIKPGRQHVFQEGVPLEVRPAGTAWVRGEWLDQGTYDWSRRADVGGFHWARRADASASVAAESPPTR